ncbi:MAG: amylo-alpha-1,6-glucosidase [Acidobacteriota bacterium]
MNKFLLLAFSLVLIAASDAQAAERTIRVALLSSGDTLSAEERAAFDLLRAQRQFRAETLPLRALNARSSSADVFWIHAADSASWKTIARAREALAELRRRYDAGGRVLATGYAALLPAEMGIEPERPSIRLDTIRNDWLWDKRGLQSFRGHPLFEGLFGGEYLWDPDEDQVMAFIGYMQEKYPARGRVIAVDKAYVFLYAETKLAIEHRSNKGMIVSVGSCVILSKPNQMRGHLERFLSNALSYLSGKKSQTPVTYWERSENIPKAFRAEGGMMPQARDRQREGGVESGLLLRNENPANQFYDVAGRRALFMGKENGGIDELWVHPYKVLYQYQAGVVAGDSVAWLSSFPLRIEVRPESFTRIYRLPKGELRERIVSSIDKAGGIVEYHSAFPCSLVIRYKSDFRWMWPYDVNALGDLYYGYDGRMNALHLRDRSGDFYTIAGTDVPALEAVSGQFDTILCTRGRLTGRRGTANVVAHASRYELNETNGRRMTFAVIGTNEGRPAALDQYRSMLSDPDRERREAALHYRKLLSSALAIESPDRRFDTLFQWAIVGTDKFFAETPGVGSALLAGYSTTARGWDGAQKVSGRPGYAWYFGRDAAWSSFAIDDYGDFDKVRSQLEFYETYQDESGKIFHEISTSGVVHYDASDATPLYLMLAGHYLRASGDTARVRKSWPHLKRAFEFLRSTDTDHDGLIENTNVGHGWVEGGALFGVHTELYLAALWAQALKDMSLLAQVVEEYPLSASCEKESEHVRTLINTEFWNDSTKFYNFGKFKDGTYQKEPTVTPAVGAYLGLYDEEKTRVMLRQFGSNRFSSDWGIRIVSSASPLYAPTGYHYGSIWPLFTGWAALAEYEYGNSTQGFMHIWDNMNIKNHWALGYVEEVMHGAIYRPTGICPHQCWSETNILHPAITGMIGWKPDALSGAADLRPRFPVQWDTVTVRRLAVGSSVIRFSMKRAASKTVYEFALEKGAPVDIRFAPELPLGMRVTHAVLDGKEIKAPAAGSRGILAEPVVIGLRGEARLVFEHTKGFGLAPVLPEPSVGDSSKGFRIIDVREEDGGFRIDLEGKAGETHEFPAAFFDQKIGSASGADVIDTGTPGRALLRVTFEGGHGSVVSKELHLRMQ